MCKQIQGALLQFKSKSGIEELSVGGRGGCRLVSCWTVPSIYT